LISSNAEVLHSVASQAAPARPHFRLLNEIHCSSCRLSSFVCPAAQHTAQPFLELQHTTTPHTHVFRLYMPIYLYSSDFQTQATYTSTMRTPSSAADIRNGPPHQKSPGYKLPILSHTATSCHNCTWLTVSSRRACWLAT
jgi:hypothetical protein